ncbi:MAG: TlyA family RNA methyltransferase [Lachnospiraceae bacterium]|nr:TlyA family RNA methyltransferase [Lachnospiraceae bacterium]
MMRLDALLVNKGLAPSRERAKELIKNGQVSVNGKVISKASYETPDDAVVKITGETLKYVSRGGLKLEKAVDHFSLLLDGLTCMDIGASTGGFTDVMLQNGAKKVFAVDVGTDQLHPSLKADPRVVSMEQTNIRDLTPAMIGNETIDFVSIDVSFISLKLVLPVVKNILKPGGNCVCLIKPQFEAGKQRLGKNGVVKDKKVHEAVKTEVSECAEALGFKVKGITESPIRGPEGNTEFLMLIESVA